MNIDLVTKSGIASIINNLSKSVSLFFSRIQRGLLYTFDMVKQKSKKNHKKNIEKISIA